MIVFWSGGIESTALLKWYLLETTEDIHAVHIRYENSANRAHLEEEACHRLEPHLQAIRPFKFHVVRIAFPFDVRDSEAQVTVIPALLRHLGQKQFTRGLCREDWKDESGYAGPRMDEHTARARFGRRMAELVLGYMRYDTNSYANLHAEYWQRCTWQDLYPFVPQMLYPKAWHMAYLGDLLPLTWSCLKPVNDQPCGECGTCKLINTVKDQQ